MTELFDCPNCGLLEVAGDERCPDAETQRTHPGATHSRTIHGGTWDGFEVISTYSDAEALEDGTLVDISGRLDPGSSLNVPNARATVGIFSAFAELARRRADIKPEDVDGTARLACQLLYRAIMRKPADEDGWRKTEARSDGESIGEVWLIPNELGGLTLMLPSDY